MNALAVFFLSTLLTRVLIRIEVAGPDGQSRALQVMLFERYFAWAGDPMVASLAWALANVLLWLALMWPLYRRGIHLTV